VRPPGFTFLSFTFYKKIKINKKTAAGTYNVRARQA
jgi:hypothetical protein